MTIKATIPKITAIIIISGIPNPSILISFKLAPRNTVNTQDGAFVLSFNGAGLDPPAQLFRAVGVQGRGWKLISLRLIHFCLVSRADPFGVHRIYLRDAGFPSVRASGAHRLSFPSAIVLPWYYLKSRRLKMKKTSIKVMENL